jgi:hypothetical protein
MRIEVCSLIWAATLALIGHPVPAWSQVQDHWIVLELGANIERGVPNGPSNFGPALSVEVTPIEDWLEMEWGVEALTTAAHTEVSADWLFKKPFQLAPGTELMIGAGPMLTRTLGGPEVGTHYGIEAVLDFMFWTGRDLGWYLEPSWSRTAGSGERAVGLNFGLLIGWH